MSNLIQRQTFPLIEKSSRGGPRFGPLFSGFHTSSIQKINETGKKRFVIRFLGVEALNLEENPTIIGMAEQYVKTLQSPKADFKFVLKNAMATMFDRLSLEMGAPKSVVLILLVIVAQNGGSYYQGSMRQDFEQKFRYKNFRVSIREVLDAITDGFTDGNVRYYEDYVNSKSKGSDLDVKKPILSLEKVFVELRDDIYYIAYLGKIGGDLFPRFKNDEITSNKFIFEKGLRDNDPLFFVWLSSFQYDNPRCPLAIRDWLKLNRHRFLLDPIFYREEEKPTSSMRKIENIDGSINYTWFDTLEKLNLEEHEKVISMAEQYVFNAKPTKLDAQFFLRQAIAAMFDRLVITTGAPKAVILIILAMMAQCGVSYYQHHYRHLLDEEFAYKRYHLTIREVLDGLTFGITRGAVLHYDELQTAKEENPYIIRTRPSLEKVFVELRDDIYYISDLGNLGGDLYPRYIEDYIKDRKKHIFADLKQKHPRYYLWLSSFQRDNPHCPIEIRNWLNANRDRFMHDPRPPQK